jgi:histidinol-phosphate aminotransferase
MEAPCLVAIDEAYTEFAGVTYRDLMERAPNLAILRTMSKFAGLAGMRVGYGIIPSSLVPYMARIMPGFCNVSAAATATAIASLSDEEYNQAIVARIVADRDALSTRLSEIPGAEPLPSATNFLLVRLPVADAGPVVRELANRGVYVRHFRNPEFGIADCLRVSVGTAEENMAFAEELEAVLAENGQAR